LIKATLYSLSLTGLALGIPPNHLSIFILKSYSLFRCSIIVASAQAFFLVLPSKIAEAWFPEHQRSLANVLTFIANPFGVVLGTIIPSLYFGGSNKLRPSSLTVLFQNASMAVMTTLTFMLSLFIRRGEPPTPPSASSENHSNQFERSLCRNKQFVIQLFTFGLAFAELWGFMVIMSDIITEQGYNLYGYPTALAALVGMAASLVCGAVADCTKRFKELIRICWVCFALVIIFTRIVSFSANVFLFLSTTDLFIDFPLLESCP
uniref:MFS domain-containing protein n=1 Tax=Heligmosomoides polygyrus TaxID=6339 RepID=A0A183FRU7_HELPZ